MLQQPPQVFSIRGFEALFPRAGTLACVVCLAPQLFLPVYPHSNVGQPAPPTSTSLGWPAAALPQVLSTQLPISARPTGLYECSLTPWLSGFHTVQFSVSSGCFLFLNLLLSFWLYEEAQCVYLPSILAGSH